MSKYRIHGIEQSNANNAFVVPDVWTCKVQAQQQCDQLNKRYPLFHHTVVSSMLCNVASEDAFIWSIHEGVTDGEAIEAKQMEALTLYINSLATIGYC